MSASDRERAGRRVASRSILAHGDDTPMTAAGQADDSFLIAGEQGPIRR